MAATAALEKVPYLDEVVRRLISHRVADAFGAAGSSISEVGQQLGDWLAKNRNGDDE